MNQSHNEHSETALRNAFAQSNYSRHLRVIGQQLESASWETFNLSCTADGYQVIGPSGGVRDEELPTFTLGEQQLQRLWHSFVPGSDSRSNPNDNHRRAHFSIEDLEQRDRSEQSRRRNPTGYTDGHTMSQLLRTIGTLLAQKNHKLLAISWQELSICIVFETSDGRKEVDTYRPDNLYDSWVRCYLKRGYEALSDQTR